MLQSSKVSALYCQHNSIYKALGVDTWDATRDARLFPGGNPVICHPPCAQWSKLRGMARPDIMMKMLAIRAVAQVQINGGVLEHPMGSFLWHAADLPGPGQRDIFGGFTLSVNQFWFGHKAQKPTLLYICGCSLSDVPAMPLNFSAITHTVCCSKGPKLELSKQARLRTPDAFAEWLVATASICKPLAFNLNNLKCKRELNGDKPAMKRRSESQLKLNYSM